MYASGQQQFAPGAGDWRLEVSSDLDIDMLPYVRSQTVLIEAGQPERR
ncbi:MAG: hypothetical protein OXE81_04025 [Gammaproteobacteria bacterium]|nr:hypothetical protein [Gammaproteobacteria bacterium]MCY4276994.1 hypothetical protein [Gammaproteobacteria bacterium]